MSETTPTRIINKPSLTNPLDADASFMDGVDGVRKLTWLDELKAASARYASDPATFKLGYLDSTLKIPAALLPQSVTGGLGFIGGVAGNSVPSTAPAAGNYYSITSAGTSQSITWAVGDQAIYTGTPGSWIKIDAGLGSVSGLFTNVETETFVSEEASGTATWSRLTSTFSGFSTNVGVRGAFKRVRFYIKPFDALLIPSIVRVRIRENNSAGTILGDATASVSPQLNTAYLVTVDFPTTVNSALPLWLEVFTNGRTGLFETSSAAYPIGTFPQARYSTDANVNTPGATAAFSGTTQATQWVQFYSLGSPLVSKLSGAFNRSLAVDSFLAQLFSAEFGFLESASVGSTISATWVNESSTFTGWGALCGPQQNFSAVRFYVRPWSSPITQVRVVVKQTDVNGSVLADKTVNVVTEVGVAKLVTVDLGTTIANSGASPLYLEYHCDAKCGLFQLSSVPYSGTVNYWVGISPSSPGAAGTTSARNFAVFFGSVTNEVQSIKPTAALLSALNVVGSSTSAASVQINLPSKIYAVEGIETNVYFRNIIRASVPLSSLQIDIVCAKGKQYGKFWRVTPVAADAASHNFQINVYSNGALVASKTCTLVIKTKTVGGGATRKILTIGDSLKANGKSIAEIKRIDANATLDSNLSLTFVGTKTGSASDSLAGSQTYAHEAISGKSFSFFNSDVTSPFVFSGAFNFATYLSTNTIAMVANDWVLIHLGTNDVFSYTDDTNLQTQISAIKTILDAWITNIKAAVSDVRIAIALPIPVGDENSFGTSYDSNQTQWRYERNRQLLIETLLSLYDNRTGESIYIFADNAHLDADNNFPTDAIPVNALNTGVTFLAANNGVHPADSGYWQMGQSLWSFLKGQES